MTTARCGSARSICRASYLDVPLYTPDRAPCELDLSDNTNLWGPPPSAREIMRKAAGTTLTRYPSPYAEPVALSLAEHFGVRAGEIVTGCGSDDVLDSAIRAFAEPGDRLAYCDPSFAMVPIFARMNALEPAPVPLLPGFDIDAGVLLATGARIIYICSPNNPTGTEASAQAIRRVIDAAEGLVIIDEAYAEFAGDGYFALAPRHEHVLVVRTMSKAFGLAGLRIGYGCGAPALVAEVAKSRGPYKVGAVAEAIAGSVLRDDADWVRARIDDVRQNRVALAAGLVELGLEPIPSRANFVLVPVAGADRVATRMRALGVAVRPYTGLRLVGDALRITVGPWPVMERCLLALRESLSCE